MVPAEVSGCAAAEEAAALAAYTVSGSLIDVRGARSRPRSVAPASLACETAGEAGEAFERCGK
jgi:hypothetical protein